MLVRRGFGRVGRPGLIGTMARTAVVAGTATAVVGGMRGHQEKRAMEADQAAAYQQEQAQAQMAGQQQMASPPPPATATAAAPAPAEDGMAQLEKLAEMHGDGLLDDAEFAAAKERLLGL